MKNRYNLKEVVLNQILAIMEKENVAWNSYLDGSSAFFSHVNIKSKKLYTGINQLVLSFVAIGQKFQSSEWATFKQWKALDAHILKGSKATKIIYYKQAIDKRKSEIAGKDVYYNMLKSYLVFNKDQTSLAESDKKPEIQREIQAELVVNTIDHLIKVHNVDLRHSGANSLYYSITGDYIHLPFKKNFHVQEAYYTGLTHELSHWTGATSRLGRDMKNEEMKGYAHEELVAELCSAMLCYHYGIGKLLENQTAYIKGWLTYLKDDVNNLFKASTASQRAFDYLMEKLDE